MTSSPPRRRRGRQPRPSLLSSRVKAAVAMFASHVGQPRVIEPAGFRDFRGWLAFIGGPNAIPAWTPLIDVVLRDTAADIRRIDAIKHDLVREIVKAVVVPRQGESSKLVSTNCGRQCARPVNGLTLMTILDSIFSNIRHWKEVIPNVTQTQTGQPHISKSPLFTATAADNAHRSPSTPNAPKTTLPSSSAESSHRQSARSAASSPSDQQHTMSNTPRSSCTSQPRSSHSHTSNEHSSCQWAQARRERSDPVYALPSFKELEDSLQSPKYLRKRARR